MFPAIRHSPKPFCIVPAKLTLREADLGRTVGTDQALRRFFWWVSGGNRRRHFGWGILDGCYCGGGGRWGNGSTRSRLAGFPRSHEVRQAQQILRAVLPFQLFTLLLDGIQAAHIE